MSDHLQRLRDEGKVRPRTTRADVARWLAVAFVLAALGTYGLLNVVALALP